MTGRVSQQRIKRLLDVTGAIAGFLVFAPVMLVLAFLVWRDVGWPVLFRQRRAGLHGQPFEMIKFRTMRDDVGTDGQLLSDTERLTDLGRFLRRTSLDELPELWNVCHGDMSIVGPRPLLTDYLPYYTSEQQRRHHVRPGVTGWAQINGRNSVGWDQKFAYDIWYVDNNSLRLDARILSITLAKVIRRHGIAGGGVETMTRFDQS